MFRWLALLPFVGLGCGNAHPSARSPTQPSEPASAQLAFGALDLGDGVDRMETACRSGGVEEGCNGIDDDCNGAIDDACVRGRPMLQVVAAWTAEQDVDLIVSGPSGTSLVQGGALGADGGRLRRTAGCDASADPVRVEAADWERPVPGTYRVELAPRRPCGEGSSPLVVSVAVAAFGESEGVFNTTIPPDRERTFVLSFNVESSN